MEAESICIHPVPFCTAILFSCRSYIITHHSAVMLLPGVMHTNVRTCRYTPCLHPLLTCPFPCAPALLLPTGLSALVLESHPKCVTVLSPDAGTTTCDGGNPTPTNPSSPHVLPPPPASSLQPLACSSPSGPHAHAALRICCTPTVGKRKGKKPMDSAERGWRGGERERKRENDRLQSPLSA